MFSHTNAKVTWTLVVVALAFAAIAGGVIVATYQNDWNKTLALALAVVACVLILIAFMSGLSLKENELEEF